MSKHFKQTVAHVLQEQDDAMMKHLTAYIEVWLQSHARTKRRGCSVFEEIKWEAQVVPPAA